MLLLIAGAFLVSCTGFNAFRTAERAEKAQEYDKAVAEYMLALSKDPENLKYRIYLQRAKLKASQYHFENAKDLHAAKQYPAAVLEYQMAVQLDPNNQFAANQLAKAQKEWDVIRMSKSELEKSKEAALKQRPILPKLDPKSKEPMSFSFPKPTEFQDICKAISKAFGFNVIFDSQIKEKKVTVELKDVKPEQALDSLMQVGGCFYKVMDEVTIIVVPETQQNRRAYEDLVIQTFYLSNGDVKDVSNVLRSIIDAKRMGINQELNAIVLRDSVDKVALAAKIIESNDKSLAEVLLNVELMEVDSNKLQEIGSELSSYGFTANYTGGTTTGTSGTTAGGNTVRLDQIDLVRKNWSIAIPNIAYSLIKNISEAQFLAQPQLRISEGEKASLHLGDRVPIVTAQFQPYAGQTTGGYQAYNSFQYTDVGIKIDIEPRIHHNREVTLKLKVEVSAVSGNVDVGNGQKVPQISTRTIQSVIRLKDGETNLLAGLLRTDKTVGQTGFPWIQDLPLIGALFSKKTKSEKRTDLILSITPQIIRMPDISDEDLLPIWAGTEENVSMRGSTSRVASDQGSPFDAASGAPSVKEEPQPKPKTDQQDRSSPRGVQRPGITRPGGGTSGGPVNRPPGAQSMGELPFFGFAPSTIQAMSGDAVTLNLTGDFAGYVKGSLVVAFDPAAVSLDRADPFPGVELSWRLLEPGKVRLEFSLPEAGADLATLKGTLLQNVPSTLSIIEGVVYDAEDAQWPVEVAPARIQPAGPVPTPLVLLP
jgi:general secretion pathway protein D